MTTAWRPIETAPRDGTHIFALNADATAGFGYIAGKVIPLATTVHWFKTEVDDGEWYPSVNYDGDMVQPFHATHWQPIVGLEQAGSRLISTEPEGRAQKETP